MKLTLSVPAVLAAILLNAQSYQKIHNKAIVIDTHKNIPTKIVMNGFEFGKDLTGKTHSDLARWKPGGLD